MPIYLQHHVAVLSLLEGLVPPPGMYPLESFTGSLYRSRLKVQSHEDNFLFDDTVPPYNFLFDDTVPPDNFLLDDTVLPDNFLFDDNVPPDNF